MGRAYESNQIDQKQLREIGRYAQGSNCFRRYIYLFDAEDLALANGILKAITDKTFVFLLHAFNDVLQIIEPADIMLQRRETGYQQAMPLIEVIQTALSGMRSQATFNKYYYASTFLLSGLGYDVIAPAPASRRKRVRSTAL